MKFNQWTTGLATAGVISLASVVRADDQMGQVQMSPVQTAVSRTTLSGYVDTAMQWNPNTDQGPGLAYPGNVGRYAFSQNDGFQLNAVDIALDRPEDSSQWSAGYHVEMMYGSDAVGVPLSRPASSLLPIGESVSVSSLASIRQAFIRLHTPLIGNGIDWQVGVFDSPIGYESSSDPLNPNYTRSYGYTLEPTTFTGVLGTYKVTDNISVSAGVANDEYDDSYTPGNAFESQKAYIGSTTLTAPESFGFLKGATLSGGVVHNANSSGATTYPGETTSLYAGVTLPTPITGLKLGAAFDYLKEDTSSEFLFLGIFPDPSSRTTSGAYIWNVAAYATYQATENLSFNARGEFLNDHDAYNSSSPFPPLGVIASTSDIVLYPANHAEELTATVQYDLWSNVIARGEFRWDHVEHGDSFGNNGASANRANDFMLALNLIYQF